MNTAKNPKEQAKHRDTIQDAMMARLRKKYKWKARVFIVSVNEEAIASKTRSGIVFW